MTQVFLNYRADDEPFGVTMLDQELSRRFGPDAIFLAAKSIPLGSDWEHQMYQAIDESVAVLVIIGRNWGNAANRRRLEDPADHVRREIRYALDRGKQVVPVRLAVPRLSTSDLPEALADLAGKQDIEVRFRSAKIDVDRLATKLAEVIPALRPDAGKPDQPAEQAKAQPTFVVERSRVNNLIQAGEITFQGGFHAGPAPR